MMYYFDEGPSFLRPLLLIIVAGGLIWGVLSLRSSDQPLLSTWRGPQAAPSGSDPLVGRGSPLAGVAVAQGGGTSVVGPPTISPERIDEVLRSYNSPAAGMGQAMYDLGVKYGIDPAFCLAFFIHESTAGTAGVARVTKSVGNIRTTAGYQDYQGYRRYNTWEEGIEDWYKLISELYIQGWGLSTVEDILPVYAPPADNNDTPHYIATVVNLVNQWRAR